MLEICTHAWLVLDIVSMKLFVCLLGRKPGRPEGLRAVHRELLDSHLFFFDRYSDLEDYHRARGRTAKADRLAAIAEAHYQAAPGDDDPEAAAMAMPVPRPPIHTNAVSTKRLPKADEPNPSELMRSPTA